MWKSAIQLLELERMNFSDFSPSQFVSYRSVQSYGQRLANVRYTFIFQWSETDNEAIQNLDITNLFYITMSSL